MPEQIHLDNIAVPEDRIRKEFDEKKLEELAESIWRVGLIHPIVLRDDGQTLLAGERRTRALKLLVSSQEVQKALGNRWGAAKPEVQEILRTGNVPFNRGSEWLSDSELVEAELFENLHRENLTWQEQARTIERLHQLRTGQKGEGKQGATTGQTVKATAAEVYDTPKPTSDQQRKVAQSLELAQYLDDPMVAAAPDEKTAAKIIRDLRIAAARKAAADSMEGKSLAHSVVHGDVYEMLKKKDPMLSNFDIIVCDPPYGRDMHKHGFVNRHEYADGREEFERFCSELLPLLYSSAAGKAAHIYVFSDVRDWEDLALAAVGSGWDVWGWPLIWDKGTVGSFGNAKQGPRHCYDSVLYGWKGTMQPTAMFRDVIPINQQQGLPHPAGKPIALYMDLLKRSAVAGMRAFDPMVGGGTFFDACSELKLHGTGVERHEKYYHMAMERVAKLS